MIQLKLNTGRIIYTNIDKIETLEPPTIAGNLLRVYLSDNDDWLSVKETAEDVIAKIKDARNERYSVKVEVETDNHTKEAVE